MPDPKSLIAPAIYVGFLGIMVTVTILFGRNTDSSIKALDEKTEDHRGLDIHPKAGEWLAEVRTDAKWLKEMRREDNTRYDDQRKEDNARYEQELQKLQRYQWEMLKGKTE